MSDGSRIANVPARRAIARWAFRLFRREWRQQLLVLSLLVTTVGGAVAGITIAENATSDAPGAFGTASAMATLENSDNAGAQQAILAARQRFGTIDVIAHRPITIPGTVQRLDLRDTDPNGTYTKHMAVLRAGRYPVADGEIALTPHAAAVLGVQPGGSVELDGRREQVVGLVENSGQLSDQFALFAPGTMPAVDGYTLLFKTSGGPGRTDAVGSGGQNTRLQIEVYGSNRQSVVATVVALATVAMALVALVAAVGFVVIAQRRLRQLGLLAAIGASSRHVRMVTIANGTIVGVVAAVAGSALGIAGWMLAAGAIESAADHRISRFAVPWPLIGIVAVLAVAMATLAAWWPARSAARVPVMTALSGRPPRPLPVHRSLIVAAVLVGGGATAIYLSQPTTDHVHVPLLITGLIATVFGSVFVSPAAVQSFGRIARWLPFAPRLALRDLARYQARAGAALAATSLALGIAAATIGIANASIDRHHPANLSKAELLIRQGPSPDIAHGPSQTSDDVGTLDRNAATIAAAMGADLKATPLSYAFPSSSANAGGNPPVSLGREDGPHSIEFVGVPFVATPEVLGLYGIDPSAAFGVDLLTVRPQTVLLIGGGRPDGGSAASFRAVGLPNYDDAPNTLITPAAMQRLGYVAVRGAWIVESRTSLTSSQIDAARRAAAAVGLQVETYTDPDHVGAVRTGATVIGGMLALAIVAMAVGLIRSEQAADLRTLTATGAESRTRRALAATTAAALAFAGAVLGIAGASIAIVTAFHARLYRLVPLPLTELAWLIVGIPAIAAGIGWLLAGREPKGFSRRPLD